MKDYHEQLDTVFSFFSSDHYLQRLSQAKQSFVEFAGPFDEDQVDIESKWVQFRDWYLFDFVFEGKTCIKLLAETSDPVLNDIDKQVLIESHASIFNFYKSSRGLVYFRDVIFRDKFYFKHPDAFLMLEKDDYVQTRVFTNNKEYFLGSYLTVHPKGAQKFMDVKAKEVRKLKKDKEQQTEKKNNLLDLLLKKYFQMQRFKQVDVRKIYSDEPLFERKAESRL